MIMPDDSDLKAIEALHRKDVEASKAGDFEALRTLIDDDGVLLPPGASLQRGREGLDDAFRAMQAQHRRVEVLEYEQHFEEVVVLGDYAFEWGIMTGSQRYEGQVSSGRYHLMRILKKQPDGSWKIYRSIWNEITTTAATRDERLERDG